jgi:protein-S-isoprenylcysteine O-methyltransferase Ste14
MDDENTTTNRQQKIRYLPSSIISSVIFLIVMFIAAGDVKWYSGWIFAALILSGNILSLFFLDAGLLKERARPKSDYKKWDYPLAVIVGRIGPLVMMIIAGLDHRFSWSGTYPLALTIAGFCLFIIGYVVIFWAMHENRFFSGVVRIQKERGHHTVSTGPYKLVRHPGYLGSIMYIIGTPFALASYWALIPAIITAAVTIFRAGLEDKTLKQELDGYADYTEKVRYRILPGIW